MIVVVQHGETEGSAKKLLIGQRPDCLTPRGKELADQYGEVLSGMIFDYVFLSASQPAMETAASIMTERDVDDLTSKTLIRELVEPSGGEYEWVPFSTLKKKLPPRQYRLWDRDFFVAPPGGESLRDVTDRVQKWMKNAGLIEAQNHLFVVGPQVMKILLGLFQKLDEADICALEPLYLPYSFDRYGEL